MKDGSPVSCGDSGFDEEESVHSLADSKAFSICAPCSVDSDSSHTSTGPEGAKREASPLSTLCAPSSSLSVCSDACSSSHSSREKDESEEGEGDQHEKEEEALIRVERCEWDGCGQTTANVDAMYDHVIESHISPLHSLSACSSSAPSDDDNSDEDEEEEERDPLGCRWGKCQMDMKRGDKDKKLAWLTQHFFARHAARARPIRCLIEGCSSRVASNKSLEDHIRNAHGGAGRKRKRGVVDAAVPSFCEFVEKVPHLQPFTAQMFDRGQDRLLLRKVRRVAECGWRVKFTRIAPADHAPRGAAKRKSYTRGAMNIEPADSTPKRVCLRVEDTDRECFDDGRESGLRLDDLFRGVTSYYPMAETVSVEEETRVVEEVVAVAMESARCVSVEPTAAMEEAPPVRSPSPADSVYAMDAPVLERCDLHSPSPLPIATCLSPPPLLVGCDAVEEGTYAAEAAGYAANSPISSMCFDSAPILTSLVSS